MEGVRRARAVCRWIRQRIDNLQLLDDGTGPSVRDDQGQRIFMFRTNVDEMNVESIDLSGEMRQGVQFRFDLAPIEVCRRPIAGKFLDCRQWHALRFIRDRFPIWPPRRVDAPAQFGKFCLWNMHLKRTNSRLAGRLRVALVWALVFSFCAVLDFESGNPWQTVAGL